MSTTTTATTRRSGNAIVIIGILFFVFGFVTWLNGTLIPFLKLACELHTDVQAFFVTSASYIAYFCLAIPSALILKRTGYKNGMALGLLVMAAGSLLFIPAASVRSFPFFLTALFVQFTGLALLQTASNPYITVVGPLESAARRISIMGICNKVAGMLSPLIVGAIVLKNATALEVQVQATTDAGQRAAILDQLAGRVVVPYVVMAGILILLALMIRLSSLPEIQMDGAEGTAGGDGVRSGKVKKSVFDFPHLLLGVICIFTYVGVEVLAGDGIGTFGKAMGMPL
ncbi:MAG TPA: MFS transporter, partial [Puia sp.]|nr:MFS transporter [Puia sp.]